MLGLGIARNNYTKHLTQFLITKCLPAELRLDAIEGRFSFRIVFLLGRVLSEEINRTQKSKEYGSYFLKDQYLNGNDRSTKRDSSKEIMMITGGKQMTIL